MNLERVVAGLVEKIERRFYGKYRGIVVDNQDPSQLGRLKLKVPSVLGPDVVTGWATPCVPYGGAADQGFLFVPERGAGVWVEFEEGDLEFPIWVGTFWSQPDDENRAAQAAAGPTVPSRTRCRTRRPARSSRPLKGHTIQFEDADDEEAVLVREGRNGHLVTMNKDGITIVDKKQNTILLNDDGVKITDATGNAIKMTGSALTVTAKVPFKIDASGQAVTIVGKSIDLQKG